MAQRRHGKPFSGKPGSSRPGAADHRRSADQARPRPPAPHQPGQAKRPSGPRPGTAGSARDRPHTRNGATHKGPRGADRPRQGAEASGRTRSHARSDVPRKGAHGSERQRSGDNKGRRHGSGGGIPREREKSVIWVPGPNAREIRAEAGLDLAHFIVQYCNGKISVRAARRCLEEGCCRIDGRIETYGSRLLKRGEVVEFTMPESHEHTFDARRIIYDAGGVIAYDKPAWLAVTPTDGPKSWSLFNILSPALGELHPVHRLDADTSGIVLFARTGEVADRLVKMFRDHAVKKTYIAIARGHPRETGTHRSYLVKVTSRKGYEKWASGRGPEAREAITNWTVEERLGAYGSRLRIEPQTGRTHQIRIHFSELGFPLYGDRLYGDRLDPIQVPRQLLHASRVLLPHPSGGPALEISCPTPREFAEAEMLLRKL